MLKTVCLRRRRACMFLLVSRKDELQLLPRARVCVCVCVVLLLLIFRLLFTRRRRAKIQPPLVVVFPRSLSLSSLSQRLPLHGHVSLLRFGHGAAKDSAARRRCGFLLVFARRGRVVVGRSEGARDEVAYARGRFRGQRGV